MDAAVIVAAGRGLRMGGPLRKQYLELDGLPILSHTLRIFDLSRHFTAIVLVVPESEFDFCEEKVLSPIAPETPVRLVSGGAVRQESVCNGLRSLPASTGLVAIHDGVRPLVTHERLRTCMKEAEIHGACILGMPVSDTLKSVSEAGAIRHTVDRENVWMAQTPQVFRYDMILNAHEHAARAGISATDDAMLMEKAGHRVLIIPGGRHNIKITTPDDLLLAEALLGLQDPVFNP